jgi:predicted anti-sigma-YlaC factor YlaD
MSEDMHSKARSLVNVSRVEGISGDDRAWLDSHLESCAECRAFADSVGSAVSALRSFQVSISPSVMEATRRRVRARAIEMQERRARMRGLWIACALSWLLGACSAPLLWVGFRWLGERMDLPQPLWIVALGIYWLVPAALGAAVLAKKLSRSSEAEDVSANGRR